MVVQRFSTAVRHVMIDRRRRWLAYGGAALALGILAVFPQPHLSRARILPRDPSNALGSFLGASGDRLQDLGTLFGGGAHMIDLYLAIGESADIRYEVIDKLHLVGASGPYPTREKAALRIERDVDVQSLPGGLLQIQAKTHDAALSQRLTVAFTDAISRHLRAINSEQVGIKQNLLQERFKEASARLARAQAALNTFRSANRISAAPEAELTGAISIKAGLEAKLQAKLVELKTLQEMLGPDNPRLRTTETEVQGLRDQLAKTVNPADTSGGPNAGGLTQLTTKYLDLYRDYLFAQSVYSVYSRLSEQVAAEDLSDRSALTIQYVEVPHIDPGFHFNVWAVAALSMLGLIVLFVEFYAPATGIDLWGQDKSDELR